MLKLTFWKVSLKGKAFTLIRVPPIAMVAVVIITRGVIAVAVAVVAAAMVMAPGKNSGKNPEKSSLRRKRGFPLGLSMQKGV